MGAGNVKVLDLLNQSTHGLVSQQMQFVNREHR